MSQAVVVKCPGCQRELRVPVDMMETKIRCKFCSTAFEARKKRRMPIPKAGVPQPVVEELDDLPELEPVEMEPTPPPMPNYTPAATQNYAAPAPAPAYSNAPLAQYTDGRHESAFDAGSRHVGRGRYRGPNKGNTLTWIVVGLAMAVTSALVIVVLVKPDLFGKKGENTEIVENQNNENPKPKELEPKVEPKVKPKVNPKNAVFPRRLLSVNVSNYLFVNPVGYGDSRDLSGKSRNDTHASITKLVNAWKIPTEQFYELTDGATSSEGPKALAIEKFPMKSNVTKTIELFCETARAQDRLVFIFSGHAIEKDGKAYLVPIEGEFDNLETLIPIEEVYAKFGACKAQEKLVIWDVCRFNPDRGIERPSFGAMTEGLEKALHNQPDGVMVLTACSKDEYSYEFDYAIAGPRNAETHGSVFLSHFRLASSQGVLNKTGKKNAGGIQSPEEQLPYRPMVEWLTEEVSSYVPMVTQGKKQTPKFSGKEAPPVEYDPSEAMTARFEMPKLAQGADPKEVAAIFAELRVPPLKSLRKDMGDTTNFDVAYPFTKEAMEKYKPDNVTMAMIEADREKYAFRAKVLEAYSILRELQQQGGRELPEEFRSPIADAEKRRVLDIQREPAIRQARLRNIKGELEALETKKEKEPLRWQAHYDYVLAQVKLRYAYLSEYDLALGKVRQEQLPTLEGRQSGWRLASSEKMKAPKDIRDMADEARATLAEIVEKHPNTPWALVAKREKGFALGLEWQASAFDRPTQ